jgi:hypothetical protein
MNVCGKDDMGQVLTHTHHYFTHPLIFRTKSTGSDRGVGNIYENHNLQIPSTPTIIGLDWRVRGPL